MFNNKPIYTVPYVFSYQHVLLLCLSVCYIVALCFILKKHSFKTQKIILIIISAFCCVIFCGRMFFCYEGGRVWETGPKTMLLPLEFCNLSVFITLLAVIMNKKTLNNFVFYASMLGGLISLIVFSSIHMYPRTIFDYMVFDYYFLHTNLVAIPIAMVVCKWFKPCLSQVKWAIVITFGIYTFLFGSCLILRNIEAFKYANYMYVLRHNNLLVLRQLYSVIPIPYLYALPLALPIWLIFYLMGIPFHEKGEKYF